MKIGLVLDDSLDPPDGVQQYVLTVGRWLSRQGHAVHYLVGHTTRSDIANIHSLSRNQSVSFNGNRMRIPLPASKRTIQALLSREQYDVLHVQMPYSPFLAGRIISLAPARTVVIGTFHIVPNSTLVRFASSLLAIWCRRSLKRFDAVVSVSPAAQTFAKQAFGITSTVLPNAVRLDTFRQAQPTHRPPGAVLHVIFLGRLVPRKGCLLLLQAVERLTRTASVPAFHVTICGRGPLADQLEQFVTRHHLDSVVSFTGFVSEADKPAWLASADIAVFPSMGGESFGIVLVEAMASGRSVVLAGDNAGYRTILGSCPEPVLFNPSSPQALTDRLLDFMQRLELRQRVAGWQSAHINQYDVQQVGERLLEIYSAALQSRRELS